MTNRSQSFHLPRSVAAAGLVGLSLIGTACSAPQITPAPSASSTLVSPSATPSPADPTSAQTTTAAAPTPSQPAEQPLGTPSLDDLDQPAVDPNKLIVTDVRIGLHDGFERVVFETAGTGQAGWFTKLTDAPRKPGSGFPIEYEGETALWIAIRGVSYPMDAGIPDFEGDVAGQGGVITGIANQMSYEGQHEFAIGLARQVPYSVTWLPDPGRVVVDFKTS